MLSNQEYKTVKHYSELLKVSQRTIHNDIKGMEKFLHHFHLIVQKKPSSGVKIEGEMNEKLNFLKYLKTQYEMDDLQDFSPSDRKIQIKKMLLIEEQILSYQGLSDLFFVSKSSIAADLEKIQSELNDYSIEIKGDQKGTYITGSESQIQYSLVAFNETLIARNEIENHIEGLHRLREIFTQYYPEDTVTASLHAVRKIEDKAFKPIAEHYLTKLFNTMTVLCYRAFKGKHHLELLDSLVYDKVKNLKTYLLAKEILDEVQKDLSIDFTTEDIIYLNQHLIAFGIESSYNPTLLSEKYNTLIKDIIQKMNSILKIDLSHDEKLTEGLTSHIIPMIYRLRKGISVKNPLLNEIKEEYSVMLGVSWFVTSIIEEVFEVHLTEDEVSFMMVHFQAALERNSNYKKALIVCPNGIGTSELIANKVKHVLPALCHIEVIAIDKLYKVNIESIDFIISAIPLNITSKPVIYVSALVTNSDIKNIMNFCAELFFIKEEKKETIDRYPTIKHLSPYITKDGIFPKRRIRTQEEALDYLIQQLKNAGDVVDGFEESIYKREKVGTTALETGVAIPHGTPKFVKNTRILILTTEEMIEWGGTKVDTIILISIAPKDIKIVKNILSEIYLIVETRKKVKYYFSENTKERMVLRLKGGDTVDREKLNLLK